MSLSVDVDIADDTDLLGKYVGDLQEDIVIDGNSIKGKLLYVTGYTDFSPGDEELQTGNYLALHCTCSDPGATITVTLTNPSVLDEDGIIVLYIRDKDTQTVKVVASKEGVNSVTKTFKLSDLVVETE